MLVAIGLAWWWCVDRVWCARDAFAWEWMRQGVAVDRDLVTVFVGGDGGRLAIDSRLSVGALRSCWGLWRRGVWRCVLLG